MKLPPGKLGALLAAAVLAGLMPGCAGSQPYLTCERLEKGLVVVLTGIEGRSPFNEAICKGLDRGGVDWAIELCDWTVPAGPLYNLRAQYRNRQKAGKIAQRIVRYQVSYPDRPVVVVGQSGGGAMAVWVAEAMPEPRKVDGLILLDAALSCNYLLDAALKNSSRGLVNFHSLRDWMLVGTTVSGTMDGQYGPSAGRYGFGLPAADARPRSYERLFQVVWNPKMAWTGHHGLHLTSGAAAFVAAYVAPMVTCPHWTEQFVAEVSDRGPPDAASAGVAGDIAAAPPRQPGGEAQGASPPAD